MGFVQLFGVVGSFLAKPQFLKNLEEEYFAYKLEEDCLVRRIKHAQQTGESYLTPTPMSPAGPSCSENDGDEPLVSKPALMTLRNGALKRGLIQRLEEIRNRRTWLDKQRRTWWVKRTLVYPISMLVLLLFAAATAFLAVQNTLQLLIGIKALPLSTTVSFFIKKIKIVKF